MKSKYSIYTLFDRLSREFCLNVDSIKTRIETYVGEDNPLGPPFLRGTFNASR